MLAQRAELLAACLGAGRQEIVVPDLVQFMDGCMWQQPRRLFAVGGRLRHVVGLAQQDRYRLLHALQSLRIERLHRSRRHHEHRADTRHGMVVLRLAHERGKLRGGRGFQMVLECNVR
jgi:hypothetical protein